MVFPCPDEHGFKGILVAPTVHGNLIVGPDAYQVEDGDHVATVEPYLSQVKSGGLRSVPGIDFRQTIHEYAGVRPNTQIPDFVIEESPFVLISSTWRVSSHPDSPQLRPLPWRDCAYCPGAVLS